MSPCLPNTGGTAVLQRLAALARRHPHCALRRYQVLEQRAQLDGDEALALDALCEHFALAEPMGLALTLRDALGLARHRAASGHLPRQAARVFEALGRVAYQTGEYFEATAHWSRAVDLAHLIGEVRVGVAARIGLGQIHYALGAWDSGRRFHRDGRALLDQLDDSYLSAKLALNMGVGHLENAQLEEARQQFELGLSEARRGPHPGFVAEALWQLSRCARAQQKPQEALQLCRQALDMAQRQGHAWLLSVANQTWTELAIDRQEYDEAIRSCRRSLEQAQGIQSRHQECQAHLQLARLLQNRGDDASALQHLWQHIALQTEIDRLSLPERMGVLAHYELTQKPPDEMLLDLSNQTWQIESAADVLTAAQATGQVAQQIMRLDGLYFWWAQEDGGGFVLQDGGDPGLAPSLSWNTHADYLQLLTDSHEALVLQDLRLHPCAWQLPQPGLKLQARSRIEIPIFVQRRLSAVLWLEQRTQSRSWSRQDVLQASHIGRLYERLLVALDLALSQRAQAEIVQEKAEVMGRLVASVAHEVNTPIGVAVTAASSLSGMATELTQALQGERVSRRELLALAENLLTGADLVQRNLERAASLIVNFKKIAVDQSSEQVLDINLNEYVRGVLAILQPALRRGRVSTVVDIPADINPRLAGGPLTQVLSNLVMNSLSHAFGPEGGQIKICARLLPPTSGVSEFLIEVQDNGSGASEAVRARMFEPFFTTKRGRGGSGLGLYIVNAIIKRMGGQVELPPSEQGLCVRIRLPLQASITT